MGLASGAGGDQRPEAESGGEVGEEGDDAEGGEERQGGRRENSREGGAADEPDEAFGTFHPAAGRRDAEDFGFGGRVGDHETAKQGRKHEQLGGGLSGP